VFRSFLIWVALSLLFTLFVKLLFLFTSMLTSPPPQLQPPHTAAPTAIPTPNEIAAAPNA
jgi:hypothetical protein